LASERVWVSTLEIPFSGIGDSDARKNSRFFELARVLVGFDHVASFTRSVAKLEGLSQPLKLNKAIL
jgi:hypothetical protein